MKVTDDMIRAGVKKASELGLLPRKSVLEDIATNNELMLQILEAAFVVHSEEMDRTDYEFDQYLETAKADQHRFSPMRS